MLLGEIEKAELYMAEIETKQGVKLTAVFANKKGHIMVPTGDMGYSRGDYEAIRRNIYVDSGHGEGFAYALGPIENLGLSRKFQRPVADDMVLQIWRSRRPLWRRTN